ncbi:hypothetical protein AB0L13_45335 [Saccharopolyspora shandongensis]|uniref:hypothetical protein n=1 Tax=Saccharopolyspora shandongensis TaxID=418495 RepID=UPI0034195BBE
MTLVPISKRPADVPRPARCTHLRIDPRGYPIIATVGQGPGNVDFGTLSEQRKLALATFDLCAVCALPFGVELRWQVTFNKDELVRAKEALFGEAPVHEVCGLYASQVCPFVSSPYARLGDQWRKGMKRPEEVVLAGYRRTHRVYGQQSGLQTGTGVLHFQMKDLVKSHTLHNSGEAAEAYVRALETEPALDIDPQEQVIVELLCNPTAKEEEDSGGVMAGAAWYAGAAFCPGVHDVLGMDHYVKGESYLQLALQVLFKPGFSKDFADVDDAATRAAMNWLNSRSRLPAVLERWRQEGRRRFRPDSSRDTKSSTDLRKAKRKTRAASRRKNR